MSEGVTTVYIDLDTEDWTGWRWHIYPGGGEWDNTAFNTREDAEADALKHHPGARIIDCDDLDENDGIINHIC